jgi:hypothetical protein
VSLSDEPMEPSIKDPGGLDDAVWEAACIARRRPQAGPDESREAWQGGGAPTKAGADTAVALSALMLAFDHSL